MIRKALCVCAAVACLSFASAEESLRIFTWEGYVQPEELAEVNKILKEKGYDYKAELISTYAEGPDQMFQVLRDGKADVSFLTLNYIMMLDGKIAKLIQPVNTGSPRLENYKQLNKNLTTIPMGMSEGKPLYIPFGGGAYGIWANLNKYKQEDLPVTLADLAQNAKWKGKLSLTQGQIQPNVALASLMAGESPFAINDLIAAGKRNEAIALSEKLLPGMKALYGQVGEFWESGPKFKDDVLTASYGVEISGENAKGGKWVLVKFKEGQTVWLDTINFHTSLSGKKLEAAEIFANYFIGKQVQERVVNGLSMVAVSTLVSKNPLIDADPNFFNNKMFWPPYSKMADNLMKKISDDAMKAKK